MTPRAAGRRTSAPARKAERHPTAPGGAGSAEVLRPATYRGRTVLEWDEAGKPLVVAKPKTPPPPDPNLLREGQLVDRDGEVWRVVRVTKSAADVRCEVGRKAGETEAISTSSAGHRLLTPEAAAAMREGAARSRATAKDETRCPNCWRGEPGVVDGVDRGRDSRCPDHRPSEESVRRAALGAIKPRRDPDPPEVIERVLALRRAGKTYSQIDAEMGWPDAHGGRSWKIVKANPGTAPVVTAAPAGRKKER